MTLLVASCSSDNQINTDQEVIISETLYNQTNTDNYTIEEAVIIGDTLRVTIQSSGCDGSEWDAKLVDSGVVAESYPVQRFAKISLKNEELCDAILTRNFTFNITSLRVEDQLYLNLEGWDSQLHYDF
jgi:hypothetical protein